jgi:hypothetical protein
MLTLDFGESILRLLQHTTLWARRFLRAVLEARMDMANRCIRHRSQQGILSSHMNNLFLNVFYQTQMDAHLHGTKRILVLIARFTAVAGFTFAMFRKRQISFCGVAAFKN